MIKRIGEMLLVLALLICCVGSAMPREPLSPIVQVQAGNLAGSGVIYQRNEEYLVVATAAHVLAQFPERIAVTFSDGGTVETGSYYVSAHSDLAFINIKVSALVNGEAERYKTVQIDKAAFDGLQGEDTVVFRAAEIDTPESSGNRDLEAVNTEYTGKALASWIFAEDFGQYMMLLQGDIEPGMSGGGVFDTEGNFLGIICGESNLGEVAAVPLSIMEAEYLGVY